MIKKCIVLHTTRPCVSAWDLWNYCLSTIYIVKVHRFRPLDLISLSLIFTKKAVVLEIRIRSRRAPPLLDLWPWLKPWSLPLYMWMVSECSCLSAYLIAVRAVQIKLMGYTSGWAGGWGAQILPTPCILNTLNRSIIFQACLSCVSAKAATVFEQLHSLLYRSKWDWRHSVNRWRHDIQ